MLFNLRSFFNSKAEYKPYYEKENSFNRIVLIHSIGAFFIAPLFTIVLYLLNAPELYLHFSISYSLAFPVYILICKFISPLNDKLIYFIFFHLFTFTFFSFESLFTQGFLINEFQFFFILYVFSIIIIQRLYPAILYTFFVLFLLLYAYINSTVTEIPIPLLLLLFIVLGATSLLILYSRTKMFQSIKDYSKFLKLIINNPGSGYVLFDIKKTPEIIDCNKEGEKFFQIENKDNTTLTQAFFEKFSDSDLAEIKKLKTGQNFKKVVKCNHFERTCYLEYKTIYLQVLSNNYWLTNINNITDQYLKNEDLKNNEEKYRNLYNRNKSGLFTLNNQSMILEGNNSFFKMFDSTININDFLFSNNNISDWNLIVDTLKNDNALENYQVNILLKNNINKTFMFSWYLNSKTQLIEGSVIDLTLFQKSSLALKVSEEKYKLIFQESNDAILILNSDKIIDANNKALELFNKTRKELLEINLFKLSWDTSLDSEKKYQTYKSKLNRGKRIKFDWFFNDSESKIEAEIIINENMFDDKLYYQCVIHDKTEENKLAKEKVRAEFAEEQNIVLEKEIKEKTKAENKLQEQLLRTKAIFESSSNTLLLTISLKKEIVSYNSHCKSFFKEIFALKISKGPLFDNLFIDVFTPQMLKIFKLLFNKILKGSSHQFEVQLFDNKKNDYWLEIFMNPILDTKGNVVEISIVAHDISDQKKTRTRVEESLKEKEVLLKEIHHRVKNNLQIISSILNLQSSFVHDEGTLEILRESRNRIGSMAIIHESLYQTEDFSSIEFGEYLKNLSINLMSSYRTSEKIKLETNIEKVDLILDQAIPCGLIVNELISNSLKYAWDKEQKGKISINIKQIKNKIILEVTDDGKGLPTDFEKLNTETLGLQLVSTLVEQLDGELKVDSTKGTKYLLTFDNIKTTI